MPTTAEKNAKAALRESMDLNGDIRKDRGMERNTDAAKDRGMDSQKIINALAAIVFGFMGWWSNNIWSTVQVMQSQVTTLNIELARNYVPRAELQANFERIQNTLERIDKQTRGRTQ